MSRAQRRYARRGSAYAVRVVPVLYCMGSTHAVPVLIMLYGGISYAVLVLATLYWYYLCCRRVYLGCMRRAGRCASGALAIDLFFRGKREYPSQAGGRRR